MSVNLLRKTFSPVPHRLALVRAVWVHFRRWTARNEITLDETAQRLIQDAKEREMKRLRVANEIRSIGEAADPIPNVFASTIGTSGAALALMAGTRGLAAPALASAYTNIEFNDLSLKYPQMSTADKTQIAAISGAAQAALDYVGVKALVKLPGIKSLIAQPLTKQLAGRALARGAMSFGLENLVEAGQDIATPALMQALKSDVPGFDWEAEQREFWKGRADVAIGLLPLILLGIGASSVNEYRVAKNLLSWNDQLGAAGVVETDRVAVIEAAQSGDMGKAQSLLMEAWGRRNPEVAAEYQDAMSQRQTDMSRATAELERLGAIPTLRRDGEGWTVTSNGTSTKFATWEEARDVATAAMGDMERAQTELVASLSDSFMASTPGFLKGESVEFNTDAKGESLVDRVNAGAMTPEQAMEAAVAGGVIKGVTMSEARAIAAEVFGGQNASERAMQFRQDVEKIAVLGRNTVQNGQSRSTVNAAGNERSFLTAVEEVVEGRWKGGLERRAFTKDMGVRWVQLAEAATGETFIEGSTWEEIAASPELAPRALTEAISRIVVADVLGRMKDGKRIGPGTVSSGLNLNDREQSALAAILDAFRKLFRALLETASKLAKARQDGKLGGEYDALFDALTGGSSQLEHDAGALQEAASIIDTSGYSEETPGPNGETFSVRQLSDSFQQAGKFYRIVHGEAAFRDVLESGLVRTNAAAKVVPGASLLERLKERPTAFPSFSKDYAAMHYAQSDANHFIIVTEDASLQPSTSGRHSKGKTYFPTNEQGEHLSSLPADKVDIFRHVGDGIYQLAFTRGKVTSEENPGPNGETFSTSRATPADSSKVVQMPDGAQLVGPTTFSIRAYHGTPHKVDKFSLDKIGTGEGAQAYGWGLYFAENQGVARDYQNRLVANKPDSFAIITLDGVELPRKWSELLEVVTDADERDAIRGIQESGLSYTPTFGSDAKNKKVAAALEKLRGRVAIKQPAGNLYTVELLPDESEFLDWDKPLSEQSEKVKAALLAEDWNIENDWMGERIYRELGRVTIEDIYGEATTYEREPQDVTRDLLDIGISGIRYLDGISRGKGDGTRNFVIFNENLVRILEENGKPVETFSLGKVTPAQDAEYLAAVEAGDMAKAQRMVDEAAKAAGYNVGPVYHGTDAKFTTFERDKAGKRGTWPSRELGYFFSPKDWAAKTYGKRVISVFLRLSNPWKMGTDFNASLTAENAKQWGEKLKKGGYDGVIIGMNQEYVVFDPNQIKSADPVTRDESGAVIPLSQRFNPADNRITFSIRPGDFSARMEAKFSLFQAKPELRLAIAQVAKERALRLGAEWIAKGDVIRSAKNISKEQAFREADGFDRRMKDYLDGLSENARQTLEFEPSALEGDPLVSAMLDFGKLMSQSTAKKSGKVDAKSGDYDGQPWLPPAWFSKGSGIMPDQMAQAMFDAGMLPDAYTGTLWSELEKRIEATRKDKAAHREAVQAYKDAQKAAKTDAKLEAEAWANQARKTAGSAKAQRDMLKAALRTLDGILAAAPPEVRARVGGYVKLAGLATDEAMLAEIERRIDKLNVELEKYLKKQAVAEISKLFKKARPDMEAGKKGKGKDADMHLLFAAAEAASDMDALAIAGRLADLDARIASGELTAEQEILAITERGVVELVGDLKSADSGRAFSALDTLRDIYQGAWLKWKLAEIERKERRAGLRQDFIDATGKAGVRTERTEADKVNESLFGKGKAWLLNLSSMHEVLAYAFGLENSRVAGLVDAERTASNTYEDTNQRLGDEIEALFTTMAGSRASGERLRWNLSQRTIKTGKGELSQLEAIQALLMWRQEDGRRHMEGTTDENGKVTSSWSYDQAWIDEIEAALTPEARQMMSFIMGKYSAEWATLNPLYRARYGVNMPHHDAYAPITVTPMQTKAGEVVDPVTGSAVSGGSILTPGSLRTRGRNAIAEPDFRDALQTMILHSRQMEYWKAYYDLAVEMNAVLGNREVMNSVHAKGGKEAANALRQWIDAIGQGGFRDASLRLALFQAGSKMQGRAAGVALLGRMSAVLSQSTQLAAAAVKIPVTSYLVRLAKLMTGGLGWRDAMRSDFIQRRFKTAPPIVRQAMDSLASAKPNEIQQLSRFFGNVLSGADAFFTSGTYAILLDYHREQGRAAGLTGAELDAYAHTEAERATEQVAQPTRMANRSLAELSNTGPLGKIGWAFASEARQKVALAAHAALNAKNDPVTAAKSAFLTFAIGGLFTQVLKNLLREAKGDDDREMWSLGRLGYAMTVAPIVSAVPFGSAIAGDSNMLSNVQRAAQTLGNEEVDFRDVDAMLSAAGLFNDTAASLAPLSHLGLDLGRILTNATE
jgi:hypothetical protein